MSAFRTNLSAVNPREPDRTTPPLEVLVDPGSLMSWLPADSLRDAGIVPVRNRVFQTATTQRVERPVGYAVVRCEGFETIDEIVFAEPGDMNLLGVRTLEGFGVMVDPIAHKFVATTTLVA